MATKLQRAVNQLKNFISYDDDILNKKLDEIVEEIKQKNSSNLEIHIPVGNVEKEEAYIGDLEYIEDYEVNTFTYQDSDYNEWETKEEYEEHIKQEIEEKVSKFTIKKEIEEEEYVVVDSDGNIIADGFETEDEATESIEEMMQESVDVEGYKVKHEVTYYFDIIDDEGDIYEDGFENEEEAKERIAELKEELVEEKIDEFETFETKYDEVYWNYVFQFNGYVNTELAKQLGMGVLTINNGEHAGEEFMFFQGCGMDLSPKLVAYQAIEFGYVREEDVYKISNQMNRDYFVSVIGGEHMFERVAKSLGIYELLNKSA